MSDENDNFEDLRRIAQRAQERAKEAGGKPAPPLKPRLGSKEFLATLPVGVDANALEHERNQRNAEAIGVRGMLPEVLRVPTIATLATRVPEPDFLRAVRDWTWGCGNLLLLGPTGSGRSTAAACLYRRLLAIGVRDGGVAWANARFLAWFHAGDLADASHEHARGRGEAPELGQAGRARLLVLDDAGWDRDPLPCSTVLKERYEQGLPTIVTSGKTEQELVSHYGAAVVRRMTETGGNRAGGGIMARFPAQADVA